MINKILWVDDEIHMLKPHILFMEQKGYEVVTATDGYTCLSMLDQESFELLILDEMMIGIDGLQTLEEIYKKNINIPVIMLTKSEEEDIFLKAVGKQINDYLTKPISPLQLYLSVRKILEKDNLIRSDQANILLQDLSKIRNTIEKRIDFHQWIEINRILVYWSINIHNIQDVNLQKTFERIYADSNKKFADFIEQHYKNWLNTDNKPQLAIDIPHKYVVDNVLKDQPVCYMIISNARYDQLQLIGEFFKDNYTIVKDDFFCFLPSISEFGKATLFGGISPRGLDVKYPNYWENYFFDNDENTSSLNWGQLLCNLLLSSKAISSEEEFFFKEISLYKEISTFEENLGSYYNKSCLALVLNYLDFDKNSTHMPLLSEMMSNEYNSCHTIKNWFEVSRLKTLIVKLLNRGFKVVITSDHGMKRVNYYSHINADNKFLNKGRVLIGKNISAKNKKQTWIIQQALDLGLPDCFSKFSVALSKEDYTFLYSSHKQKFYQKLKGSFRDGGVSLEEIIMPVFEISKS